MTFYLFICKVHESQIYIVFCKSLMKMVKFGPTFVVFLKKSQQSENS